MKVASCILICENNKFLAVSRKDDHNDFGFAGGKVDNGELFSFAAIREALEETGYHVAIDKNYIPYIDYDGDFLVYTFKGYILPRERIATDAREKGVVKWVSSDELIKSSFGKYNQNALKHFGYLK